MRCGRLHRADVRVAIGAVGPVPERLDDVEDQLTGALPVSGQRLLRGGRRMAVERVRSRSRQTYRREVLVNFVERALGARRWRDAGLAVERLPKEMPTMPEPITVRPDSAPPKACHP
jgi:xanthine dehydrogenase FAD-binding subunit